MLKYSRFALLVLLLIAVCHTTAMAQTEISSEEYMEQAGRLANQYNEYFENKDFRAAEKLAHELIALFYGMSRESQDEYSWLQAEIYFSLASLHSLQNNVILAVDAFEKAVNLHGFTNYSRAKYDSNLDNIREDRRFIALMESVREKGNLLSIEEVRERVIEDRPLILNADANWNNQRQQTKEEYLDGFMARLLYWFFCADDSRFNAESDTQPIKYIYLVPSGYEHYHNMRKPVVVTHDSSYFWEH